MEDETMEELKQAALVLGYSLRVLVECKAVSFDNPYTKTLFDKFCELDDKAQAERTAFFKSLNI